ncbi:MAG: hypothetical protein A4S09_08765 [Proteobacteria bacterium SG_bin7]|nr:MAG: hypothetical protein A4S09_08765 [Proteobacteria bacterium SG_bin7]
MTTKYQLPNKMSVILLESKKAPVVSTHLWVKTGSADEKKGEEGISHFIEHLVFKGTKDFKVGEIAQTIEGSGGQLNAYTTFDQTVYHVTISKNYYDKALHAISQMAGFPKFDEKEIDNEREVVIEEIKRSEDSPSSQASQLLFKTSFQKHPYGIPIIGYEKIIKNVKRKTLVNYYSKRYVPQNMTLIVSGDFDSVEMKSKIKGYFGQIKPGKLEKRARKKDSPGKGTVVKVNRATFEETFVYLAWKVPDIKHKDIVALDLMSMMLGEGDSARLYRSMRLESAIVNYVGTSCFTLKDPGLFLIAASLNAKNMGEFFEELEDGLKAMMLFSPSEAELKRCITLLESDEYYDLETVDGLNRKAGFLDYFMGDYRYYPKYLKQVYGLKPEDIAKTARKYLNPKNLTITIMTKEEKANAEKFAKTFAKNFGKEFKDCQKMKLKKEKYSKPKKRETRLGGTGSAPEFKEFQLKNGLRMIFRLAKDTPVISMRTAMLGGLRSEPSGKEGLTDLLSRSWCSGAGDLDEHQINELTDSMAARLSAFGGRNSAGLSVTMLSPHEKNILDLLEKIISSPKFEKDILEREKGMMLEALKTQMDQPSHVASLMFLKEIFSGHPYARDPQGTEESIRSLTREDVVNGYKKLTHSVGSLIVVSGQCDPELWVQRLNDSVGTWKLVESSNSSPLETLSSEKFAFKNLDKEQTHIITGFRGLVIGSSQRYAMQIMQSILGGMGGRLFTELREKASLAYSVSPINFEGTDTGYCGAYIGCSPDKGKKAVAMMMSEFEKISQEKASGAELERAKRYLIGRHDIELQRNSAFAGGILFNELYGLPYQEIFSYSDRINEVTASDVQALAQKIFSQKKVCVAVGPSQPW